MSPALLLPALAQTSAINSTKKEADRFREQGNLQFDIGQNEAALQSWQQALKLYLEIKDRERAHYVSDYLQRAYYSLGNYPKAIDYLEQSLVFTREIKNRNREGYSLTELGKVYYSLSNYPKAIDYLEQSLVIAREIKDQFMEVHSLSILGNVYNVLGNYPKSIDYHEQALAIARKCSNPPMAIESLRNLGKVHNTLGNYSRALEYHEQAESLANDYREGSLRDEGSAFGNLGNVYNGLSNYPKAIDYHEQHLAIAREIKDRQGEGKALGDLGITYQSLGNYPKAIDYYEQSLAINREIKDREGEGHALVNLGRAFENQQQKELAIIFYKQSVTVRESIRRDIRKLPRNLQESYTQTVAGTYRTLADLLLSQGRVLEAQQVLELLKIQELRDYTRETRAGDTTQGAPLNPIEAPVVPPFNTLIDLGLKLTTCESQKPYCPDRPQLISQRDQATTTFNQQADRLRTLARQGQDKDPAQLQQQELTAAAYKIVQAQPNTVLIYPLVLQDKLWLVYGLQAGKQGVVFASKEIPVSRKDLSATVTEFRQLLENPNSDRQKLQQTSQKLYRWLLEPLRPQLDANNIQNLVFSLDRSTRYLPIAALHDGNQYLAQRFTLSTILTAGLTDTQNKLSPQLDQNPVLALGLSNATPDFPALPNVANELNAIVKTNQPNSQGLFKGEAKLNTAFTLTAFKDLTDYRILHLATHGKFISEDPEQSFLLLGNGDRLNVKDIQKINDLGAIHLVVLSACETAQGGPDKEGIEVSVLSYYFLTQNAKSVLASLWRVNDASTSQLMQQFYKNLATGKLTKPEALRQAQLSLIQGNTTTASGDRGGSFLFTPTNSDGKTQTIVRNFNHPYYWAPFILIGNGL